MIEMNLIICNFKTAIHQSLLRPSYTHTNVAVLVPTETDAADTLIRFRMEEVKSNNNESKSNSVLSTISRNELVAARRSSLL
jgi:hypothetical protein